MPTSCVSKKANSGCENKLNFQNYFSKVQIAVNWNYEERLIQNSQLNKKTGVPAFWGVDMSTHVLTALHRDVFKQESEGRGVGCWTAYAFAQGFQGLVTQLTKIQEFVPSINAICSEIDNGQIFFVI